MACTCNVDCLPFHNIKHGISDSIVFKYDETKMDKTGEFVQEKNVYSNPLAGQGHLCFFTALGVISPFTRSAWLRQRSFF